MSCTRRSLALALRTLEGLFGRGAEIVVNEVPVLRPERSGKFLLAKRDFLLGPGVAATRTEPVYG
jgi:hypothetical protein